MLQQIGMSGLRIRHYGTRDDLGQPPSCPFCRTPEEASFVGLNHKKRAAKNDPNALHHVGCNYSREGDHSTAIEYWEKASGLRNIDSHVQLSWAYQHGHGVAKDKEKFIFHLEQEAAIGGHPPHARHNLPWCVGIGKRQS